MNQNIIKLGENEIIKKFNEENRLILKNLLQYRNIFSYVQKIIISTSEFKEDEIMLLIKKTFPSEYLYSEGKNKREKHLKDLLNQGKPKYQSLGQGILNDKFYFGNIIDSDKNIIITSNREKYISWDDKNNEIKEKFGLNYKFNFFDEAIENSWSSKGKFSIYDWLYNEKIQEMKTKELFDEIRKINSYYISHYDEAIHDYIACDILSNYVYSIFNEKGRTYFQADYGSGKSKQASIYALLSFNSVYAGSITPASFERIIESTGCTIIADNLDNLDDEKKKQTLQVVEVYYKKGGKTIKADGEKNRPTTYEGYSPMVINNIIGLPEVTQSRCNTLPMLRTENKELSKRKIIETDEKWVLLKNKLHIWALQHWKEVKGTYYKLDDDDLSNRDFEKAVAVLTIAKLVSDEVYNNIKLFLINVGEQQKVKDLDNNWEFTTFSILYDLFEEDKNNQNEKRILIKDITVIAKERLNLRDEEKLKYSHYAGKVLTTYPQLFFKTYYNGNAGYNIKKENLWKAIKLKGYDKVLSQNKKNPEIIDEPINKEEITINVESREVSQ
jgi:hypothetical protein